MKESTRILLIEDDENLGSLISEGLKDEGFEVSWEKGGEPGLLAFKEVLPQICILDIMLPDIDGFEIAKQVRAVNQNVPILFLTAKELPEDRIKGFESGGDDYITKPFLMKELVYRIGVFLRRSSGKEENPIKGQDWELLENKLQFIYKDQTHKLTKREFDVLAFFLKNPGRLIPREEILFNIWGDDDYFMGRSLDVFITRLRTLLKDIPNMEIHNVRGVGFRFDIT